MEFFRFWPLNVETFFCWIQWRCLDLLSWITRLSASKWLDWAQKMTNALLNEFLWPKRWKWGMPLPFVTLIQFFYPVTSSRKLFRLIPSYQTGKSVAAHFSVEKKEIPENETFILTLVIKWLITPDLKRSFDTFQPLDTFRSRDKNHRASELSFDYQVFPCFSFPETKMRRLF